MGEAIRTGKLSVGAVSKIDGSEAARGPLGEGDAEPKFDELAEESDHDESGAYSSAATTDCFLRVMSRVQECWIGQETYLEAGVPKKRVSRRRSGSPCASSGGASSSPPATIRASA